MTKRCGVDEAIKHICGDILTYKWGEKKFNCIVGFSDHSTDNKVAEAAVAMGAEIIEKHIGLENQKDGFDIKFSLKGKKIKKFKEGIVKTYNLLGKNYFYRSKKESANI